MITRTTWKGRRPARAARCRPAGRGGADGRRDGDTFGPLRAVALPGHSDDHFAFVAGRAAFTGDAVLGEGSVFVSGDLAGYLDGLRCLRTLELEVLCPGHGPPVWDVQAKLDGYIDHRLDRERRLLEALERGLTHRGRPARRRLGRRAARAARVRAISLRAHLEKLRAEGRA